MFDAYSFSLNDVISISQVKNANEQFGCLNRECNARFIPKALNSNISKHFCRLPTAPHTDGCPYVMESSRYHSTKILDKYTLEDILNLNNNANYNNRNNDNRRKELRETENVHTPRQLLIYCISNSINTIYIDDITVGDIIIDSRNIKRNALFRGVNGIRILLGTTVKFDVINRTIIFSIMSTTKDNKAVTLTATIKSNLKIFDLVVGYYLKRYNNRFKGHQIAVMGDWVADKKYHMITTIKNPKQIIFNF